MRLDVTEPNSVAAAASECTDVNLLINNAGISLWSGFLSPGAVEAARSEMETNYFGPLALSRAFAPVLTKNGGGVIVNVLSVLSWVAVPNGGTYSASKAAAWALTNWLRTGLREQGIQVVGVHAGPIDTDMASQLTLPKIEPAEVVRQVLSAIEAGRDEVIADDLFCRAKQAWKTRENMNVTETKRTALVTGGLLSSKPGFQRLSKAALCRSRFLRLAAAALFPFLSLRLLAATEPNPELAQDSGAAGTNDAAAQGRMGAIRISQFGPIKIHSYLSLADGFHVNTQMIEGPTAVVIFDGQLLLPYADEVASYVQTLGKPVDRVILSHAHTDHWSGLQVLTERFPDARVFALDGVADQLRARGQARLDSFRPIYGDKIATKVTVPTETITEGPQQIDGVTYDFKRFVDAESDLQLAALLPEQKVLMAFDLVFSPNEHAFTVVDHFDHWMIILESLKTLQGYDTITIGHDTPVYRSAIDSTITYVKRAKAIHAASADAKTYSESLKAAFPDRQQAGWVDFSASLLYAASR